MEKEREEGKDGRREGIWRGRYGGKKMVIRRGKK